MVPRMWVLQISLRHMTDENIQSPLPSLVLACFPGSMPPGAIWAVASWLGESVSPYSPLHFVRNLTALPVAPSLIHTGKAVSVSISDDYPLYSMQAMSFKTFDDYIHNPSPRYWLLWPGVLIMLVCKLASLLRYAIQER